jgi:hypothetical protein
MVVQSRLGIILKHTCLLITGPRSASGSIPEFTFRDFARSTSLFSLEKFEKLLCYTVTSWSITKGLLLQNNIVNICKGMQSMYNMHVKAPFVHAMGMLPLCVNSDKG